MLMNLELVYHRWVNCSIYNIVLKVNQDIIMSFPSLVLLENSSIDRTNDKNMVHHNYLYVTTFCHSYQYIINNNVTHFSLDDKKIYLRSPNVLNLV